MVGRGSGVGVIAAVVGLVRQACIRSLNIWLENRFAGVHMVKRVASTTAATNTEVSAPQKLNREERRKRRLPAEAGWGSSKMVGGTSSLISMAPFSGMPSPQGDWHLTPGFHPGYTTL